MRRARSLICAASVALAGCADQATDDAVPVEPIYGPVSAERLGPDLVKVLVEMRGARSDDDVAAYAECAAVQYAEAGGYGYARHLRTNIDEKGGLWRADAVYSVSSELPRGLKTIVVKDGVDDCAENGIPMV